jgi:hypothetical protein
MKFVCHFTLGLVLVLSNDLMRTSAFCKNSKTWPIKGGRKLDLFPEISALERIISTKAVISSLTYNFRNEITLERILFQVSDIHYGNSSIYWFGSILFIYLYGQFKYYDGSVGFQNSKFRKITTFSRVEKTTKELLYLILFIFMKDVPHAQ